MSDATPTRSDQLSLYAYTFRSRAERVLWALRELELPHRVIRLDPFKGETRTAAFGALNRARRVPVLVHGERVLTESLAIMEYLNGLGTKRDLLPDDAAQTYDFRRILHYGLTEIEPYLWVADQAMRLKHYYRWPEGTHSEAVRLLTRHLKSVWPWLDAGPFLLGSRFTLADIYYYQLVSWAQTLGGAAPQSALDYLQRLEARAAFPAEMKGP